MLVPRPIYSDLNQFTPSKDLIQDVESVYQSISNILSTPIGTRLFEPEFGSLMEQLLFEPMVDETTHKLYDAIIEAIQRWEPRVTLNYGLSDVVAMYEDHRYDVFLVFTINGFKDRSFEYSAQLVKGHYHG